MKLWASVNITDLGSGGGASDWLTGISERESGGHRNRGKKDTQEGIGKDFRDFQSFLVWSRWEDALLLGLHPKMKISWLCFGFSELAGFHPHICLSSLYW